MTITQRVEALRHWMRDKGIGAYIIPTADPHNDEYIPAHWMCREWITGFTGSAGLAVVTPQSAALWTDSRYWLQAAEQLKSTPFKLMREGENGVPSPAEWMAGELKAGSSRTAKAHCPAALLTVQLQTEARQAGIEACLADDAFDALWPDRPALPAAPIEAHPAACAGQTVGQKLETVQALLHEQLAGRHYIFNDLSDIAWLLNLRGSDIPYNPVFLAYLVYSPDSGSYTLFTHTETLTQEARRQLDEAGIARRAYGELAAYLEGKEKAFDFAKIPAWLHDSGNDLHIPSPVETLRATKNPGEQEGFRRAMAHDGVALVRFLHWLDAQMQAGNKVTERSADERLTALRAEQPGFRELSFATIAGYGPHGAIVHYEADAETDAVLEPHGLLLLDSGAQYDCGTTDITRTIALGQLTEEEMRVYTLVLKGHLGLARLRFPEGTTGLQLDLAARRDMWAAGYDFGHGTGHGVGSYLCVHEGPHQIRKNVRPCTLVPFSEGMVVTDEPGIYVEGKFGVRIENILLCVPTQTTPYGRFLQFESLTLCPYDLRPVKRDLLTDEEVRQINDYHAEVRRRLLPMLTDASEREWLEQATRALV